MYHSGVESRLIDCTLVDHVTRPYFCNAAGPNGLNGFPDKGSLTARAAQLHNLTTHHDETRIYPHLTFGSRGLITGVTVLGQENASPSRMAPGVFLQLWQPVLLPTDPPDKDACTRYELVFEEAVDKEQQPVVINTSTPHMKRYDFGRPTSPVEVMEGWVLGLRHLPQNQSFVSLYYQKGGGPLAYSNDSCSNPLDDFDYPLIAVNFTSSGL